MSTFEPHFDKSNQDRRPRGQRMAALCAVALFVLSCGLLQSMADGARPLQSVAWVFGPAPATAADRF